MTNNHQERWTRVKGRLRAEVGDDIYSSWFARMELESVESETVRLSVPTRFLKSWIQSHYAERVLACWQGEEPAVRRIDLSVRSAMLRHPPGARPGVPAADQAAAGRAGTGHAGMGHAGLDRAADGHVMGGYGGGHATTNGHGFPSLAEPGTGRPGAGGHETLGGSPLDPRLTFETFVVGRSNSLAHAAAKQVATAGRGDAVMFNPLYVHSAVGLGKTHLLQAIAWAGNASGARRVLYLTAEKFVYGFVSSLRQQTTLAFKEVLRTTDVLLIDDLQFLQGKSTHAEFSHTLNAMIDAGRQVVVAADRPPLDLENLDDRVRSRLAGGLVVEMGSFGEDLRLEILQSRVASARTHHAAFDVPADVLDFIAKAVTHNGRDLEGAVNRLLAHSKLTGQPVTMELAEREIRDLVRPQEPRKVKIEEIQRIVARRYNVSRSDLLSSRRTANVVRPRQIAMYLAKTLTLRSLPEIGRRFGGRDHTTVLHAVRKIEGLVGNDTTLADEIEAIKRELQE
ncbi:Chromosomal replication initiator protein DnaA [Rhodovulum sp. PH10]|uniref:chromosomal replication initiator protein DnaA n=1 Tax=Rhodovulum sp. PH10 TaxID=1187851 RepID=UPI00027C2CC9|nr:chromosomal replication initiator protein DnaA [Rhodovulum sp. PH10]EJW12037.1 Chromosomal replication initiator protein DnaA [Rhodovulum sp. PH10]